MKIPQRVLEEMETAMRVVVERRRLIQQLESMRKALAR